LRLFFRWKLVLDPIPLFFTDFMSFHVLYFTISALYTQYLSFQTDSRDRGDFRVSSGVPQTTQKPIRRTPKR
jgi:hypothetical protein